MSDHWQTFPCTMGDHVAFITYDHAIRTELEVLPFSNCARFEVTLKDPDDRGLPHGDEFSWLNDVEDYLSRGLTEARAVPVGRITTNGRRYLFYYTSQDEVTSEAVAREAAASHGYVISLTHALDSERSHYWNELFPTDDDRQVIQDMRVEDSLREEGDPLTTPREVDHWAYFHKASDRQRFVEAVTEHFAAIELYETPDNARGIFTAKLVHTSLPDYRSMNKFTMLLNRAAKDSGGDYDGWETSVCRQ
ncbi:MAG: hypothetical protein B7Y26_11945 [Hydrogenophilales bacterium 16-64-46]|nr:MAG: hypothetical protein B7Y26_11945 [Hydrogenophilales bacterium 16-64-46]OZA38203.1 MAG: hypothetical protein B7X87_06805 [Hydrogenophilales bacterium 17-64-34]HQS99104.1 DUF695 domain-containing protein [Thiobacillus sp.]